MPATTRRIIHHSFIFGMHIPKLLRLLVLVLFIQHYRAILLSKSLESSFGDHIWQTVHYRPCGFRCLVHFPFRCSIAARLRGGEHQAYQAEGSNPSAFENELNDAKSREVCASGVDEPGSVMHPHEVLR